MQIAIYVGHRPRPPSSSGTPLFSFFSLSSFPFFSRSGIAVGTQITRIKSQATRQERCAASHLPDTGMGSGFLNSIGAALLHRWIVRASRDGL